VRLECLTAKPIFLFFAPRKIRLTQGMSDESQPPALRLKPRLLVGNEAAPAGPAAAPGAPATGSTGGGIGAESGIRAPRPPRLHPPFRLRRPLPRRRLRLPAKSLKGWPPPSCACD